MDRQETETSVSATAFAAELTELSLKHGIAIAGSPMLFVMEPEDRLYAYRVNGESRLTLG